MKAQSRYFVLSAVFLLSACGGGEAVLQCQLAYRHPARRQYGKAFADDCRVDIFRTKARRGGCAGLNLRFKFGFFGLHGVSKRGFEACSFRAPAAAK